MKGKEGFSKFINAKPSNASVKEKLRQEKKAMVKAKRDAIEKHFEEKRMAKNTTGEGLPIAEKPKKKNLKKK
jgi:hypothetical protein